MKVLLAVFVIMLFIGAVGGSYMIASDVADNPDGPTLEVIKSVKDSVTNHLGKEEPVSVGWAFAKLVFALILATILGYLLKSIYKTFGKKEL